MQKYHQCSLTLKTKIEIKGRQAGNSDDSNDLNEFRL